MSEIKNIIPPSQPDVGTSRAVTERSQRAPENTAAAAAPNTEADKVSLSDTLAQLEQTLSEVPEVDQARVDAIKAAIENGSYQIDSQELARKMINFEGDF